MSITLPTQAEANAAAIAAIAATVAAAEAAFIASTTVLINSAMNNGLFHVEPFMVPNVTCTYITSYFQALGYAVQFEPSHHNPHFAAGFPEVINSDLLGAFDPRQAGGPSRIKISWGDTIPADLGGNGGCGTNFTFIVSIAQGGTNSSAALNNNRVMVSRNGSIVEDAAIAPNQAIVSDLNGLPIASITTATELSYVHGATSSIQAQINSIIAGSGITQLTGQVLVGPGTGSQVATIATNTISNSNLAQMSAFTIKGNGTASTADPQDLTGAQVNAFLPVFSAIANGLVPFSGGGTFTFLRADGAWAVAGSGSVVSVGLFDGSTTPIYSISNSPVTGSGTLDFTLVNQFANTVFAGPTSGPPAQPTFRSLTSADVAFLSQTSFNAFFTGTISGTSTPVTITANDPGTMGDSIALVFNGSNTISGEIATWNIANPLNLAILTTGDGTQTPSLQTVTLSGGINGGSSLIGDAITYTNFAPTSATIAGALAGISTALGRNANTFLSNLTSPTAVNQNIVPNVSDTWSLGSASLIWNTLYSHYLVGGLEINLDLGTVFDSSAILSLDWQNRLLYDTSGHISLNYNSRKTIDSTGITSIDGQARQMVDAAGAVALDWSSGNIIFSLLTPNTVPYLNASKILTPSAVTPTELGYLSGVTSPIQGQLNALITATLPSGDILVGNGSNIATAVTLSGDATISNTGVLTLSNVAVTGKLLTGYTSTPGTVSATDSILTAIEKLNGNDSLYLPLAGGTMSGVINMGGFNINNLASGTATGQALQWGQIGIANGIASLDNTGHLPLSQVPITTLEFLGAWNPNTNTPTLSDGTGTGGSLYYVSAADPNPVPGLNDPSMTNFSVGNLIIYNSTLAVWQQVPTIIGVASVNGLTGTVIVNAINQLTGDVTTTMASGSQSKVATISAIQGNTVLGTTGIGNVVFSASPTLTGTITAGSMTLSSTLIATGAISGSNLTSGGHAILDLALTGGTLSGTLGGTSITLSSVLVATGAISGSNLTSGGHATLDLLASNNLSDIASAVTAFENLTPTLLNTAGDMIYENATPAPARLAIGTPGQVLTVVGSLPVWLNPATGGTVTSVGLFDDSVLPIYSITNTPVTSSGTLTFALINQLANTIFAGPTSGPPGQPTFRGIVPADIPILNQPTTGTASNITASSNSTLTTLSALTAAPSLSSVGTITSGVWNGTTIDVPHGGTGDTSFVARQVVIGGTTTTGPLQQVAGGTSSFVLTSNGPTSAPTWQATSVPPGALWLFGNGPPAATPVVFNIFSGFYASDLSASPPALSNSTTESTITPNGNLARATPTFSAPITIAFSASNTVDSWAGWYEVPNPVGFNTYQDITWGWFFNGTGIGAQPIENGNGLSSQVPYLSTDIFTVQYTGSIMNYYKNGIFVASNAYPVPGGVVIKAGASVHQAASPAISYAATGGSSIAGTEGNLYLDFNTGSVWKFISGVWVLQGSIADAGITFSDSLVNNSGIVTLVGDTATPGASQYYGTNGSSVLGYYSLPASLTLAAFGSTPNSDGASLAGQVLTLEPADGSNPGGVSTTTQSFAGNKTFTGNLHVNGTTTLDGITSIGGTPAATTALFLNNSIMTGASQFGIRNAVTASSAATTQMIAFSSNIQTAAAAFTVPIAVGFGVSGITIGAGSAVTNQIGFFASAGGFNHGTNNAILADNSAFVGNFFLNQSSSSMANTLAGNTTLSSFPTSMTTIGSASSSTINQFNGGINYKTATITAATYTIDSGTTDNIVFTDSTLNPITITLPAPTNGRELTIEDKTGTASTNNITIKQHASETINGLTQYVMTSNYGTVELRSDGTNWVATTPTVKATDIVEQVATTISSATTLTLTNISKQIQVIINDVTLTTQLAQTVKLPAANTMSVGQKFEIYNNTGSYTFTIIALATSVGTVYENNGQFFTVTAANSTPFLSLTSVGTGMPFSGSFTGASGTLTYFSGPVTGNATFSNFTVATPIEITISNNSSTTIARVPQTGMIVLKLIDNSTSDGTWIVDSPNVVGGSTGAAATVLGSLNVQQLNDTSGYGLSLEGMGNSIARFWQINAISTGTLSFVNQGVLNTSLVSANNAVSHGSAAPIWKFDLNAADSALSGSNTFAAGGDAFGSVMALRNTQGLAGCFSSIVFQNNLGATSFSSAIQGVYDINIAPALGIPTGSTVNSTTVGSVNGNSVIMTNNTVGVTTVGNNGNVFGFYGSPSVATTATTNGTTTLTITAGSIASITAGQLIVGTGIPASTTVVSINVGGGTVLMSSAATTSTSGVSVTFYTQILVTTGATTAASNLMSSVASTTGLIGGNVQFISGAEIPANTTVTSFIANTSVTMSNNATVGTQGSPFGFNFWTSAATQTVTTVIGLNTVTVSSTAGIAVGDLITFNANGFPVNTTVVSISGLVVTLSNLATAANTAVMTFWSFTSTTNGTTNAANSSLLALNTTGITAGQLVTSGGSTGHLDFLTRYNGILNQRVRIDNIGLAIGLGYNTPGTQSLDVVGNARIRGLTVAGPLSTDANGNISSTLFAGISGRYFSSVSTISGSLATVIYATKGWDAQTAYNTSTGILTIQTAGKYHINAGIATAGTVDLNSALDLQIQQTGTFSQISEALVDGAAGLTNLSALVTDLFQCAVGDTIKVQVSSGATTPTIVSSNSRNYFSWTYVGT